MIDSKQLEEYTEGVRKEMKLLGGNNGFIKKHLTQIACIQGIIDNKSPRELAIKIIEEEK